MVEFRGGKKSTVYPYTTEDGGEIWIEQLTRRASEALNTEETNSDMGNVEEWSDLREEPDTVNTELAKIKRERDALAKKLDAISREYDQLHQ
ncbi:hypothetical protein L1765_12505 [Microaerobacter geothermalis]|uniref:hypothetical protein n=1 Tax=Microaerobacter geothermalis TaxID=674972 RepID=UPI001F260DCD|nr:hypothetical protein [Microaerobacter geothermalis]MCF6094780.1 hypothetical protein [Microaerobacter geothermalis]